jgi:fumarate hydratase class II
MAVYEKRTGDVMKFRNESDSMGKVKIPADRYWGAQTQRALGNFKIGTETIPMPLIRAYAVVKYAAAEVNATLGAIQKGIADAIRQAAQEIIDGKLDDEFPLGVWQSGSGTQTNMNVNEVIANRASEILGAARGEKRAVHANDDVNCSQSTNDSFPTAMHIAAVHEVNGGLLPAIDALHETFEELSKSYAGIVKTGRTHLMDATPLTLGQAISGWAAQIARGREAIVRALEPVHALALGGTAVGTGLNTHPDYSGKVAEAIARITGEPFITAPNKFAALGAHDELVGLSGALKQLACAMMKIANDVRWLASGPRCGIGEINIQSNEPGSSIMPGKSNPTQCEVMMMVCCQVIGNDAAVTHGGCQGNFELNVFKPLITHNVLTSVGLLAGAMRSFNTNCAATIVPNRWRIEELLGRSLMLVTALSPHIGYDKASEIAHKAYSEGKTLREAAVELGFVSRELFDALVKPDEMVKANLG